LVTIRKEKDRKILNKIIFENNHRRKSFRARHYSNKARRQFKTIQLKQHKNNTAQSAHIFMASETSFASTLGPIQETNEVESTDDEKIIPNADHQPFDEEESNAHNLPFIQEMENLPISAILNTSPSNEINPININSSTLNRDYHHLTMN
jgi:hypothetical protein